MRNLSGRILRTWRGRRMPRVRKKISSLTKKYRADVLCGKNFTRVKSSSTMSMSNIKKKSGLANCALDIKSKANKTNFMGALERAIQNHYLFSQKKIPTSRCEFLIFCRFWTPPRLSKRKNQGRKNLIFLFRCGCDALGSVSDQCDDSGICSCQPGVYGAKCDSCMPGFFGLSSEGCKACDCSPDGSLDAQCDEDGICFCKEGVEGDKCDKCARNHYYEKDMGCKKCDNCYNLVEFEYNKHQDELNRLRRAAETIQSSPNMLR